MLEWRIRLQLCLDFKQGCLAQSPVQAPPKVVIGGNEPGAAHKESSSSAFPDQRYLSPPSLIVPSLNTMASQNIWKAGRVWIDDAKRSIKMCIFVRDVRFDIHLCANQFIRNQSLLDTYSNLFRRVNPDYDEDYDEDHYSDPLVSFVDWTMQFFPRQISSIPPLKTKKVYTLLDILSAKRFEYTLQVTEEGAKPVGSECLEDSRPSGIPLEEQHRRGQFPIYHPNDIHIPLSHDDITLPPEPSKVQVNGENCFFKHILPGDERRTAREISTYAEIAAANLEQDAHVPRLVGLITDVSSFKLIGLLISYIECDPRKALSCRGVPFDSVSLCNEFIRQVSHSVEVLHAHDIVWGDAKADNVLVDVHNNAWLIDFGGSFTHGWVDKELRETKLGDLQGLQRIKDSLLQA